MLYPNDNGPFYAETDLGRFPVEPWNTYSLVTFGIVAMFWAHKNRLNLRQHPSLVTCVILITIGTVGGARYHACRCNFWWLIADVLPIGAVVTIGALLFWKQLRAKSARCFNLTLSSCISLLVLNVLLKDYYPKQMWITLMYVNLSLVLLTPSFVISYLDCWRHLKLLTYSSVAIVIALIFRVLDFQPGIIKIFPMGTHFLWHCFGAFSGYFLMKYIYERGRDQQPFLSDL